MTEESKEDDVSLDFSKIKSFFKKKPAKRERPAKEEKVEDEDITIDVKKLGGFFKRYGFVLLILIPLFLSISTRIQPSYLPITDEWAQNSVYNFYRSQIRDQVNQRYPNLPDENKEALVDEQFQLVLKQQANEIKQQTKAVSQQFKSGFKDEDGRTYLLAIDSYQYYRYVRDIIEKGHIGDKTVNGSAYDTHMLAPHGTFVDVLLHPYAGAWLYRFMRVFNRNISIMGAFFYLPLLISMLAVIPAFFIGRRIAGNFSGFVAALFVAVHPSFVGRTVAGFADTDAYAVFFPLLIVWLFYESFEAKTRIKKLAFVAGAGFFIGLFAFSWIGWWYIFDFIIMATLIYIAYLIFMETRKGKIKNIFKNKELVNSLLILVVFILVSAVFVSLFVNFKGFTGAFTNPFGFMQIKAAAKPSLWPNVYTTVAELNVASFDSILASMGGKFMFFIALVGIVLTMIKKQGANVKYAALLVVWFVWTIYASLKGMRFAMLLVPAFGVAFGVALSTAHKYLTHWVTKELKINRIVISTVFIALLCLLLIAPVRGGYRSGYGGVPSMDDGWYNSLTKIKLNSSEDAIINSWWDFGHWFKAIADRAVTFDGASQNIPQAHWIGRVLLTSNEDEAIGILRMLDCKGNGAFEELNKKINDTIKAVDILKEIILLDRVAAKKILLDNGLSDVRAEEVIGFTHCSPPENFFITSADMVGKASVWAHFGSWDFRKAKIWRDVRKMDFNSAVGFMTKELGYTQEKAQKLYYEAQALANENEANAWISPWPGYVSQSQCSKEGNKTLVCSHNVGRQRIFVTIDLEKEEAYLDTPSEKIYPKSFAFVKDGVFVEKKFNDAKFDYSVVLIGDNRAVMCAEELAGSMFTRLFYLNGAGLKHFDLFNYDRGTTGVDIYIWKVDWEGK